MTNSIIKQVKEIIINDGDGSQCGTTYTDRVELVQRKNFEEMTARKFVSMVGSAERYLRTQAEVSRMTTNDILTCALQTYNYYLDHVKELENND